MKIGAARTRASENLMATYIRLGLAVRGASIQEGDGFTACTGSLDHPICNFAIGLSLNPWSAAGLREIAEAHKSFNVYVLPEDEPAHIEELLRRAGFSHVHRMVQMEAPPARQEHLAPVVEVTGSWDRFDLARYMSEQFFTRQNLRFRVEVAEATAGCGARLFALDENGRRIGAVMLTDDAGVIGIYNLCVSSERRGQGVGGAIVRWALATAWESGRRTTLQCESHLSGWYARFGMRTLGPVDVYSLRSGKPAAIMQD